VQALGKLLFFAGIALALAGALVWLAPRLPWLGSLPGDLRIERPGLRLYLPLASCALASVLLTLILNLLARWR
jgi:Protein of unknown function (DUF2905)